MPIPRIAFEQLPADARRAVADKTGTVHHTETMTGGMNSGIASVLHTGSGPVFVKGIPADHHQIDAQRREAAVAPLLPASCPRLHWHIEAAGWSLLGYEVVHGRHADYAPGSADLPLVEAALTELQAVTAPADLDIKEAADRWKNYAPPDVLHYFRGTALLHTDFAPDNILITGGRARLVDWAWPTRGAAWLDPGRWRCGSWRQATRLRMRSGSLTGSRRGTTPRLERLPRSRWPRPLCGARFPSSRRPSGSRSWLATLPCSLTTWPRTGRSDEVAERDAEPVGDVDHGSSTWCMLCE
ncbi:hypothetical protein ACFQ0Q_32215 [Streptomyces aureus]